MSQTTTIKHLRRFVLGSITLFVLVSLVYGIILGNEVAATIVAGIFAIVAAYVLGVMVDDLYKAYTTRKW